MSCGRSTIGVVNSAGKKWISPNKCCDTMKSFEMNFLWEKKYLVLYENVLYKSFLLILKFKVSF